MVPASGGNERGEAILLAGPTASGKSEVALRLAEALGAEIISADSMQVYRGLDIGTAKPAPEDLRRVAHHLIDIVGLDQPFDTARWLAAARSAAAEIEERGRRVILCGGTGLYFSAWLGRMDDLPPADPRLRAELESLSLDTLLAELAERDPETHAAIDRKNPRRVVRAVELLRLTGKPRARRLGSMQVQPGAVVFVLQREAPDLRQRIERRVDAMMARGWVSEVRGLVAAGIEGHRTPMQAIGYRQILEHLRGDRDLASTVALIKTKTWQFARRQMTWFRNQLPVEWVSVPPHETAERTVERMLASVQPG